MNNELDTTVIAKLQIESGWSFGNKFHIRWSDLDAYGHVSHRSHLVWFEEVRAAYLSVLGYPVGEAGSAGPVIREIGCSYEKALNRGDDVFVTGKVKWFKNSSFHMEFGVWSDGLVARAHALCVWVGEGGTGTVSLPDDLKNKFAVQDCAVDALKAGAS